MKTALKFIAAALVLAGAATLANQARAAEVYGDPHARSVACPK